MSDPDATRPPAATDPAGRRAAAALAGHRGDVAAALVALEDPDPAVRSTALGATARLLERGAVDRPTLDAAVRAALRDPDPAVRRRAADVAARSAAPVGPDGGRTGVPGEGVRADLVAALADPDWRVAEMAAFACGELPDADPDVVAALSAVATDHEDALCREAAVAALGSIGDPSGLDPVLAACRDRATVRRRAVLALAAFDGPRVTDELRRLAGDRDLQVRQAAEELLAIELGEDT